MLLWRVMNCSLNFILIMARWSTQSIYSDVVIFITISVFSQKHLHKAQPGVQISKKISGDFKTSYNARQENYYREKNKTISCRRWKETMWCVQAALRNLKITMKKKETISCRRWKEIRWCVPAAPRNLMALHPKSTCGWIWIKESRWRLLKPRLLISPLSISRILGNCMLPSSNQVHIWQLPS